MNPANLQLQGLLLALYALLDAVKQKGLLTPQELDDAFATAEANALADPQRAEQLSPAGLDVMFIPDPLSAHREHGIQSTRELQRHRSARRRNQTEPPRNVPSRPGDTETVIPFGSEAGSLPGFGPPLKDASARPLNLSAKT